MAEQFQDAFTLANSIQDYLIDQGFTGVIWNPPKEGSGRSIEEVEIWATEHCKNSIKVCTIRCYGEDGDGDLIQIYAYTENNFRVTLKLNPSDPESFDKITDYVKVQIKRYNQFIDAYRDIGYSLCRNRNTDDPSRFSRYDFIDFWVGKYEKIKCAENV